jgi:two-component system, OmpR family, sensor histidine kinase KdpD
MAEARHFLVAISSSLHSEYLIRWTHEIVAPLNARWTVMHVDVAGDAKAQDRELLHRNLELARKLGAEISTITADDVAAAIIACARQKHASQIIIGKSDQPGLRRFFLRPRLTQRIIRLSGSIDVLVLQEKDFSPQKNRRRAPPAWRSWRFFDYALGLLLVLLLTAFNAFVLPNIGYQSVSILYLLAITGLAFFLKRWAVIFSAALAALCWDYFFIPPLNTFSIGEAEDGLLFLMFFVTAFTTGFLATRVRANEKMLAQREEKMTFLYNFMQSLTEKKNIEDIIRSSLAEIERQFEGQCVLMLGGDNGGLAPDIYSTREFRLPAEELVPAEWCYRNNQACGRYAAQHESAFFHYLPLATPDSVLGVVGLRLSSDISWNHEQESLFLTLLRNLSMSLEREILAQAHQKNLLTAESERLGKVLLNSISHELRTPLTTIKGAVTALMEPATGNDPLSREGLLEEMLLASDKLNAIVENLLSMSRLESKNLKLKREPVLIDDLFGVVLDAMARELADHPVETAFQPDLGALDLDFVLFVQVLTNLLQNVVRHTPAGARIWLVALGHGGDLRLRVCDSGPGVPLEQLPLIFEKFFRGSQIGGSEGCGLGLSICRGITEAHGGSITASPRPGGGLCIEIAVPGCVVTGDREERHDPGSAH